MVSINNYIYQVMCSIQWSSSTRNNKENGQVSWIVKTIYLTVEENEKRKTGFLKLGVNTADNLSTSSYPYRILTTKLK